MQASSSTPDEGAGDPSGSTPSSPAPSWPPSAVAVPAGLHTAGAVFVLAGFLKILIVCFPYSTMAISMYFQGRADLGTWAAAKMLPLALGILALAKAAVDRGLHRRTWFGRSVVAAGVVALVLSRWAFARPRPSPLDPMIRQYRAEMAASAAAAAREQQRAAVQAGQPRKLEPTDEAREALAQRNSRFK